MDFFSRYSVCIFKNPNDYVTTGDNYQIVRYFISMLIVVDIFSVIMATAKNIIYLC